MRVLPEISQLQREPQAAAYVQAQISRDIADSRAPPLSLKSLLDLCILRSILALVKDLEDQGTSAEMRAVTLTAAPIPSLSLCSHACFPLHFPRERAEEVSGSGCRAVLHGHDWH